MLGHNDVRPDIAVRQGEIVETAAGLRQAVIIALSDLDQCGARERKRAIAIADAAGRSGSPDARTACLVG